MKIKAMYKGAYLNGYQVDTEKATIIGPRASALKVSKTGFVGVGKGKGGKVTFARAVALIEESIAHYENLMDVVLDTEGKVVDVSTIQKEIEVTEEIATTVVEVTETDNTVTPEQSLSACYVIEDHKEIEDSMVAGVVSLASDGVVGLTEEIVNAITSDYLESDSTETLFDEVQSIHENWMENKLAVAKAMEILDDMCHEDYHELKRQSQTMIENNVCTLSLGDQMVNLTIIRHLQPKFMVSKCNIDGKFESMTLAAILNELELPYSNDIIMHLRKHWVQCIRLAYNEVEYDRDQLILRDFPSVCCYTDTLPSVVGAYNLLCKLYGKRELI